MQKEFLDSFEGKKNVWHIISDNGTESWLTQQVSFADETCAKGACKLNTVENETKHVLFLFNDRNEEVGRYYIGKKLQGKSPNELVQLKDQMCFFESWNPSTNSWVPCISLKEPISDGKSNQNPEEQKKVDVYKLSKYGLEPVYSRFKIKKRRLAKEYCEGLLSKIDNWENLYDNAKRCVNRSFSYGYNIVESDLTEEEKMVFFWKTIKDEIEINPDTLYTIFPEKKHVFNEDNFKDLYEWIRICKEGIPLDDFFSKRYIALSDILDFKLSSRINVDVNTVFNALCQDALIEYSQENLATIRKWLERPNHIIYIPYTTGDEEDDEIKNLWYCFTSKLSSLEQKLFYWTAIFCGHGYVNSMKFLGNTSGRFLVYNSRSLEMLFRKMTFNHRTPKKIIDGESAFFTAFRQGEDF